MLLFLIFPTIVLTFLAIVFAPVVIHVMVMIVVFPFMLIRELCKGKEPVAPVQVKPIPLTEEERYEAALSSKAKFAEWKQKPRKKVVSPFEHKRD